MSYLSNQISIALPVASSALYDKFGDRSLNEANQQPFPTDKPVDGRPNAPTLAQQVVNTAKQLKNKIELYQADKTSQAVGFNDQLRLQGGGRGQLDSGARPMWDMSSEIEQGLHLLKAQMHATASTDIQPKSWSASAGEDSAAAGHPASRYGAASPDDSWSMAGQDAALNDMKERYMDEYENIIQRYKEFYQEFSDCISKLSSDITVTTDSKGNQFITLGKNTVDKMRAMLVKFAGDEGRLYPKAGTTTKENAEKWAAELGLPAGSVVKSGDGYIVKINVEPLKIIVQSLENNTGSELPMVKYNVFKEGLDGQGDKFKQTMQLLVQKYTTAVSLFDNTVKQYSSIMAKMADLMKLIIQAWS